MIFFTGDNHFGHANIIGYCGRPFKDVNEMDNLMIDRWNRLVGPDDVVYHIGDFALAPWIHTEAYRHALQGSIVLVLGNHDRRHRLLRGIMQETHHTELRITLDGISLYLKHAPNYEPATWKAKFHLCGHVHEHWRRRGNIINVGVDQWWFEPIPWEALKKFLTGDTPT